MNKDSEEDSDQNNNNNNKKMNNENQFHHHPVSEPSPSPSPSTSFRSPSHRTASKSPSPPLHSLSDSPISDTHGEFSPPQPDSSISDGHCSPTHETPPIGHNGLPSPSPSPPVVVAHRFQVEPKVVTKVDPPAEEGFVGVKDVEQDSGGGGNRRLRPDVTSLLRSKKVTVLSKLLLGFRVTAFVFCLVSCSVLAADKKQGWAQDSFYSYKEFRYSMSVNVIGFVYSGLQICDLVLYLSTRKHIVEHPIRVYVSFALDQILTYLLMSASSSAATRAYDWESNWGKDKFPNMANASVALSFVAFGAFALASLVSGSIICRFR